MRIAFGDAESPLCIGRLQRAARSGGSFYVRTRTAAAPRAALRPMRALLALLLVCGLYAACIQPANADWTIQPGQALEGGDKLYCGAPCDVHGIRNIQSPRLDIAAGNSDPNAGPLMTGAIGFCWDITCTVTIYNGHGVPLFQVTPAGSYLRAPSGRLLAKFDGRGITLYAKPRYR